MPSRILPHVDRIILTALCLGETLPALLGWRWTVGPFSAVFAAGIGLLVLRHLIWPRPSVVGLIAHRMRTYFAADGSVVAWRLALASRTVVILVGLLAVSTLGGRISSDLPRVSHNVFANLPLRFDAGWYLGIARRGYDWRPELYGHRSSIAFFPAYPLAMRIAGDLVTVPAKVMRDPTLFGSGNVRVLWGGLFVSVLCFGFALHNVYRLARLDGALGDTAVRAMVLLATYPFGLFFGVPYSESLFLFVCTSAVLAWKSNQRLATVGWGLATGLSRSNGWTVAIAFLLDKALGRRRDASSSMPWHYALAPLLGGLIYSTYVHVLTGFPLAWMDAQAGWGRNVEPWTFFTRRWNAAATLGPIGYVTTDPVDVLTFLGAASCVAIALVLSSQRRWLYAGLVAAYLLPAIAIDLPATGRMTAVMFPVFIVLAERMEKRTTFAATALVFAFLQVYLAVRFFLWLPPY